MGLTPAGWATTYAQLLRLADAAIVALSLVISGNIAGLPPTSPLSGGPGISNLSIPYWVVGLAILILWLALLEIAGSRLSDAFAQGTEEFTRVFNATLMLLVLIATVSFLLRAEPSRLFLGFTLSVGLVLLLFFRALARRALWSMRVRDKMKTTLFIFGTPESNQAIHRATEAGLLGGYRIVGELAFSKDSLARKHFVEKVLDHLRGDEGEADIAVLTEPRPVSPQVKDELSARLELLSKGLALWASPEEVATTRMQFRLEANAPLIRVRDVQLTALASLYKRVVDAILSSLALTLLMPVFILISFAIKLDSRGPVFFRQIRVGQYGQHFTILKFRSMVSNAEEIRTELEKGSTDAGNRTLFKMKEDPRVTRVGKFLRVTSLDELPQLLNVLVGEMSLVGPRPPLPSEVATYEGVAHRRLAAKPGITGLWQISGRSDLDWESSVKLDLEYVENWSPIVDILILLRTIPAIVGGRGAY